MKLSSAMAALHPELAGYTPPQQPSGETASAVARMRRKDEQSARRAAPCGFCGSTEDEGRRCAACGADLPGSRR